MFVLFGPPKGGRYMMRITTVACSGGLQAGQVIGSQNPWTATFVWYDSQPNYWWS